MARILLIDDSPLVLSALQQPLVDAGFEVMTASGGAEGLERILRDRPDVVVTDLDMPEVGGLEVVSWVRERAPELPVVILTEHGAVPLVVQAMREGAFGYVQKDRLQDALIEELAAALRHRALVIENQRLEEANRRYREELEQLVEEKTREVLELQRLQAQAEKMSALGMLVAGVTHEINNPLTVISSASEWLHQELDHMSKLEEVLPAKLRGRLATSSAMARDSLTSATRMVRLVRRLKQMSRIEREPGQCELGPTLQQVERLCLPQLREREVRFEQLFEEPLPRVALGEDDVISVVSNLVLNACHAVPEGSGHIELRARVDGADHVVIEVSDNGHGIPAEVREQVWNPFFTTKPVGEGTGLGLSLVYQTVAAAGGEASLESEEGAGTRFSLRLPVAPSAPSS